MIDTPPVCMAEDQWFIGSHRSRETGRWVYVMVGGGPRVYTHTEIQRYYGLVTWFHLVENDLADMEAPR